MTTWWEWSHCTPTQEEHGVVSEASQVAFMEGGTDVQCLKSDKRVTPSEVSEETTAQDMQDKEKKTIQIMDMVENSFCFCFT